MVCFNVDLLNSKFVSLQNMLQDDVSRFDSARSLLIIYSLTRGHDMRRYNWYYVVVCGVCTMYGVFEKYCGKL